MLSWTGLEGNTDIWAEAFLVGQRIWVMENNHGESFYIDLIT